MTICIDTNTLLQGRAATHRYFPILDAVVDGRMTWALSNRVLTEYEEIICQSAGLQSWRKLELLIELIDITMGTIQRVSPHFQFHVISNDPDDNAFTDCAIAAHADYVITDDKHFAPLANAGYKPQPITPMDFIQKYRGVYL